MSACGWVVQDRSALNLRANQGVAVREVPTANGEADYLLLADRQAVGVVEAKPEGTALSGVYEQVDKYLYGFARKVPHYYIALTVPGGNTSPSL